MAQEQPRPINLESWRQRSINTQIRYSQLFGDRAWNSKFTIPEKEHLLRKLIAVALFGLPRENRADFGLERKEIELVAAILDKCKKVGIGWRDKPWISIAVIHVCVYVDENKSFVSPVFRIKTVKKNKKDPFQDISRNKFIDYQGRIYDSWERYKKENTWERCHICTPPHGFYNCNYVVSHEFHDQTDRGDVRHALKKAAITGGILSTIGIAVIAAPITVPGAAIVGVASLLTGGLSGAFIAGDSIDRLHDRNQHQQSLLDQEAGVLWLETVFGTLGVFANAAAGREAYRAAQAAGELLPQAARRLLPNLFSESVADHIGRQISERAVMLGLANLSYVGVAMLSLSIAENDHISDLDVERFRAAVLFLANADVDASTAREHLISMKNTAERREQRVAEARRMNDGFVLAYSRPVYEIRRICEFYRFFV